MKATTPATDSQVIHGIGWHAASDRGPTGEWRVYQREARDTIPPRGGDVKSALGGRESVAVGELVGAVSSGRPAHEALQSSGPSRPEHASQRDAHPSARNASPPNGVIAPSQPRPVTARTYRLPENSTMPIRKRTQASGATAAVARAAGWRRAAPEHDTSDSERRSHTASCAESSASRSACAPKAPAATARAASTVPAITARCRHVSPLTSYRSPIVPGPSTPIPIA
jgi:hypothetical protein